MKNCIATILDDKYLAGFLLTLFSITQSTKNIDFDIIVLEWGELSDESRDKIAKVYDKVIYKRIDTNLYDKCFYDSTWREWTYNCNYRFDIFVLEQYDKVLFFDCDIIFQIDLSDMLAHDVDFGACPANPRKVSQTNKIDGFGGGLLLVGKKYLNNDTRMKLIELALSKPLEDENLNTDKWISDEPILNVYFHNKVTFLPESYNLEITKLTSEKMKHKNNYHFVGHNKPWYGERMDERFDSFIFKEMTNKEGHYSNIYLIKDLIEIYKTTALNLSQQKNINIMDCVGRIHPRPSKVCSFNTNGVDVTKFSCWPIVKR